MTLHLMVGEKMQLHELTKTMRQKDKFFAKCLNAIRTNVPESGSTEDTCCNNVS